MTHGRPACQSKDPLTTPELCRPLSCTVALCSEQVLDDHLVQRRVIPLPNEPLRLLLVKRARFIEQLQEGATAVFEVRQPMIHLRRPEGMNIKADVLAVGPVLVPLQCAHLIKGASQII